MTQTLDGKTVQDREVVGGHALDRAEVGLFDEVALRKRYRVDAAVEGQGHFVISLGGCELPSPKEAAVVMASELLWSTG